MSELTTTQETVLLAAAGRTNGSIHPMPTNIRGGAATKVTAALVAKNLIDENGVITTLGLNVADPNWNTKPESTDDAPTSTELTLADAEKAYVEADAAYEAAAKAYTDADNALNKVIRKGKSQAIIEQARETVTAAKEAANQTAEAAMTAQAILDSFAPQATTLETDAEAHMDAALPTDDKLPQFITIEVSPLMRDVIAGALATPITAASPTDDDFEEDVTTAEAAFNEPPTALASDTDITLEARAALACPANFEEADPEFMAIAKRHFSTITPENWPAIRNTIEEAYALGFEQAKARKAKTTPTRQASTPRTNSKKAMVLDMLKRAEGASIEQITEVTGWQVHTIRAFLSVAKSKMGLMITTNRPRLDGTNQQGSPGACTTYHT
ncbi:MAG: DUF3489 domain-containing protein [Magnetococcales bacterium]|nr:DUF3489 domain-containing protein [Magnetococcales bacterium]